jgi:hypothetical protein
LNIGAPYKKKAWQMVIMNSGESSLAEIPQLDFLLEPDLEEMSTGLIQKTQ